LGPITVFAVPHAWLVRPARHLYPFYRFFS
jgi:hypothetical protein